MSSIPATSVGVSPFFPVTAEELQAHYNQGVTRVSIDGVEPPVSIGGIGGSASMNLTNLWFPWIDEKLVEPKYDGVGVLTGMPSNRPDLIKDYWFIAMMRAVDYILAPRYQAQITASVGTVTPIAPPTP